DSAWPASAPPPRRTHRSPTGSPVLSCRATKRPDRRSRRHTRTTPPRSRRNRRSPGAQSRAVSGAVAGLRGGQSIARLPLHCCAGIPAGHPVPPFPSLRTGSPSYHPQRPAIRVHHFPHQVGEFHLVGPAQPPPRFAGVAPEHIDLGGAVRSEEHTSE